MTTWRQISRRHPTRQKGDGQQGPHIPFWLCIQHLEANLQAPHRTQLETTSYSHHRVWKPYNQVASIHDLTILSWRTPLFGRYPITLRCYPSPCSFAGIRFLSPAGKLPSASMLASSKSKTSCPGYSHVRWILKY